MDGLKAMGVLNGFFFQLLASPRSEEKEDGGATAPTCTNCFGGADWNQKGAGDRDTGGAFPVEAVKGPLPSSHSSVPPCCEARTVVPVTRLDWEIYIIRVRSKKRRKILKYRMTN